MAWSQPPTPCSAEVKERVELYLYSPCLSSWPVPGRTLLCCVLYMYLFCIEIAVKYFFFTVCLILLLKYSGDLKSFPQGSRVAQLKYLCRLMLIGPLKINRGSLSFFLLHSNVSDCVLHFDFRSEKYLTESVVLTSHCTQGVLIGTGRKYRRRGGVICRYAATIFSFFGGHSAIKMPCVILLQNFWHKRCVDDDISVVCICQMQPLIKK